MHTPTPLKIYVRVFKYKRIDRNVHNTNLTVINIFGSERKCKSTNWLLRNTPTYKEIPMNTYIHKHIYYMHAGGKPLI